MTDSAAADPQMWSDFHALCDLGGRLAGTWSEAAAQSWAQARLAAIPADTSVLAEIVSGLAARTS